MSWDSESKSNLQGNSFKASACRTQNNNIYRQVIDYVSQEEAMPYFPVSYFIVPLHKLQFSYFS